jgi:Zn-dependent protease with chaperone function
MIVSVYLPLVLVLLAVPALHRAAGRLHPAGATRLIAAAAVVLAGCSTVALGLLLFAALSLTAPFDRLGHLSLHTLLRLDAVHGPIDVTAAVLLLALTANAVRVVVGRARALRAAHRSIHAHGAAALVVLPDERAVAHATPGRPGQIVVSTGMLRALDPLERRALLAHERAHLDHRHHWYVILLDVLAALNPLLRPLTGAIRFSTERWADEVAAREVADRTVVARAVGKAALATRPGAHRPAAALGVAGGPVPRRVAALFAAAPERRAGTVLLSPTGVVLLAVAALLVGSVAFSLDAITDLHRAVELAQR